MNIRDGSQDDVKAVGEIYCYYVRTSLCTLEEREPTVDLIRNEFDKIFAISAPFIVAVEVSSRNICGYAYAGPFNERSGYNFTSEDSIYIHPEHCGKGLGKRLMIALLEKVRATTKTQMMAKMSISPDQAVEDLPSCRLHMAFGFKPVGRMRKVGYKFGKVVDVVILQLDLDNVST